ncbi:Gfo/Idh/MocA family oxidoreductase [Saccharomonospora sp. NPDC006951]
MKILVVGVGFMGDLHARTVHDSRFARLCGVVDVDPARSGAEGRALGVPAFTDLSDAIRETQPDAVIVATPDPAHRDPVTTVVEARLPVLVEKPLATSVADAEAMAELAEKHNVRLMTGHLTRFFPRYVAVADAVASGRIGKPVMVTTSTWGPRALGERVSATTTPLWHFAIHDIDTLHWITGGTIAEVDGAQLIESSSGAAAFSGTGVLSTGTAFHLAAGWTLPATAGPRWDMKAHGESGVVQATWSSDGVTVYTEESAEDPDCLGWPVMRGRIEGALRAEVEHFVTAVSGELPFAITPQDAVAAVRAAAMLEKASSIRRVR